MKELDSVTKKMIDDINTRGAGIIAFIVAYEDKSIQVLQYDDEKGHVKFISGKSKNIHISEKIGKNKHRPIAEGGGSQ